jgi:four helix bundle protein
MASQSFEDVVVWQKAHQLVLAIYKLTEKFPKHEMFAFRSQFRRAAISVPANIAEGFEKRSIRDKCRFYNTSQGSLGECRYYLILARDLGYADSKELMEQTREVGRMLYAYMEATAKGQ